MDYEVVYEISKSGLGITTFALPGFLFIVIGMVMYKYPTLFSMQWSTKWAKRFAKFWLGFSILWTIFAFGGTFISQSSIRDSYNNGNFKVVEGNVKPKLCNRD